jgi:putative ABC transport system substrate-binding protein
MESPKLNAAIRGAMPPSRDPRSCSRGETPLLLRHEKLARLLLILVSAVSVSAGGRAQAPEEPRPVNKRFGVFFWHDSPNDEAAFEGIKTALSEIGRRDEFLVERANESRDKAKSILDGFKARDVDLIFAMGTQAALLAREHVQKIPIVFTAVTHPVEAGVVPSWSGSKRNLAGNSNWIPPQTILQVFRLTVPYLRRIGVLRTRTGVVSAAELESLRSHLSKTKGRDLEIVEVFVDRADELPRAVNELASRNVDAIWIPIDRLIYEHTRDVFAAARKHELPIVSSSLRGTRSGATSGIVVDYVMLGKRAAELALRIAVRGSEPSSLPIGTMHGYRVVVNVEAARQSNYELPLSLLVLADTLLEEIEDDAKAPHRDK